ncbi:MAG: cyclodeaminase/cyclohydrolase family protein [Tissierellia bacterium]|nr:cyclodeaminase/cyclohydrolase family protein [Tissierellia bacterium]
MFINNSLKEFIDVVASDNPTPGGGSVSALAGSLGGALTNMVGTLTIDKKVWEELSDEVKVEMKQAFDEMTEKINSLSKIVDEDSTAFDDVMTAFKMPKETDEEKKARSNAIQEGYKHALEVPLRCAEECFRVLELQEVFANYGNVNAITDVGVGTLLAYTGLEGALFNVTINLLSVKDVEYKKEMESRVSVLLKDGKRLKSKLIEKVYERLG